MPKEKTFSAISFNRAITASDFESQSVKPFYGNNR
jgi:hypothetical protein